MTDPVSAARNARQNLAQGLGALQDPGAPPALQSVAEPIAAAMSALHRIESSGGAAAAEAAPHALDAVRHALSMLQAQSGSTPHPAVDRAMEAVAGSLGLVHSLAQHARPAAPAPYQAHPAPVAPEPPHAAASVGPPTRPSAAGPAWGAATEVAAAPQWQQPPAQPAPAQWQQPAQPAPAQWQQPAPAPQPAAAQWQQSPAAAPAPQPQWPVQPPAAAAAAAAPAGAQLVEAELGAHSATNFYKGLSGNDVIDSGGIFVATYNIPKIGQQLTLKVSMPGGYEFEALGIVRWTRDAPLSGADAPPGFGAQFTSITQEGRQLVYRYVRNREPLFHDDL
ncbi:MAG: hypothetical protein IT376_03770 [Polyangiaceae bacterium]|nr:hypothetical protein [Polyangiaceae bacterium]